MIYTYYLYWAFFIQILVISVVIPIWIKNRSVHMMAEHPVDQYPKLYPVSPTKMTASLNHFIGLNGLMTLIGLGILFHAYWTGQRDLLAWDTQAVLTVYFLLQYLPFMYLASKGMHYHQMMRLINTDNKRSASLQPRVITGFVSKTMLMLVGLSFLTYVGLVIYVHQNPFPGFAGYWNILFVTLLNVFFLLIIQKQIKGKKTDPHQSNHDRIQQYRLISQLLILGCIAANLFLASNLLLSVWQLKELNTVVQSLYFTGVALMMNQTFTYQPQDYSVYQSESKTV